jgi:flagellar biosynthesis/type III secretory pathway M-ring protein FliF/YscJ
VGGRTDPQPYLVEFQSETQTAKNVMGIDAFMLANHRLMDSGALAAAVVAVIIVTLIWIFKKSQTPVVQPVEKAEESHVQEVQQEAPAPAKVSHPSLSNLNALINYRALACSPASAHFPSM